MFFRALLISCLLAGLTTRSLQAQEFQPFSPARAVAALKKVLGSKCQLQVDVTRHEKEARVFGSQDAMQSPDDLHAFVGRLECFKRGQRTHFVSKKDIPGFALGMQGTRTLEKQVTDKDLINTKLLKRDLRGLLHGKKLIEAAARANWKGKKTDDGIQLEAQLPAKLIPQPSAPKPRGDPESPFDDEEPAAGQEAVSFAMSVDHVLIRFLFKAKTAPSGVTFEVKRFDPQRAMGRAMMEQAFDMNAEPPTRLPKKKDSDFINFRYECRAISRLAARTQQEAKVLDKLLSKRRAK